MEMKFILLRQVKGCVFKPKGGLQTVVATPAGNSKIINEYDTSREARMRAHAKSRKLNGERLVGYTLGRKVWAGSRRGSVRSIQFYRIES